MKLPARAAHLTPVEMGSRARGEGTPDSDLDLAVIGTPALRARRYEVYDLAYDISLRYPVQLAPLVMTAEKLQELRKRELRIASDLDREGIPL